MRIISIILVLLICALLLLTSANRADAQADICPTPYNVTAARLDITDGSGRNYLIDVNDQAFAAATGNIAGLRFQSKAESGDGLDHWLVNGVRAPLPFQHVYHITFYGDGAFGNMQNVGDIWFATLPGYDGVYFYYILPVSVLGITTIDDVPTFDVVWSDHPNCAPQGSYGSVDAAYVDALLKPRK